MANSLSVAGSNSKYKEPGARPAGFWGGLWHGIIAPITFLVSLLVGGVSIYETHNNGRWYEFGFMLGIMAYYGNGEARARRGSGETVLHECFHNFCAFCWT
jgi:hypothetical protein